MGAKSQKMNCMLEDGTIFMKIIDGIKDLCPDGNLDFTEHGMQMQVMDASHVSLCSLILRTNMFKQYECPEAMSLGINFKTLAMMLRGATGELRLKSCGDKLEVTVQKLTGTAHYTMNLMDIDCEHLGVPDTTYATVCSMPSATFGKVMKDLCDFSDTCSLHIGETLTVTAKGDMGNVVWKGDNCKCTVRDPVEPLDFGLRYMTLFSKCAVSSKVVLCMSPDMPICVTFPIEEHGYMRFYLAPKTVE